MPYAFFHTVKYRSGCIPWSKLNPIAVVGISVSLNIWKKKRSDVQYRCERSFIPNAYHWGI